MGIENLEHSSLQHLWWFICSLVGALFLFMNFVQGGQALIWQVAKTEEEAGLVVNSLGRKWELGFTTLVLFGGALFAAFPLFYSTSFGGAYWVWILILFTFVLQAVSYEYRKQPNNILGAKTFELFLFINGSVGILLVGAAVGTFYTGSNFQLSMYNFVTWEHPLRGLEAAFSLFNLSLGLFLVLNARTLGAMYLVNNIDFTTVPELEGRLRRSCWISFLCSLPFLGYVLISLLLMQGFGVNEQGIVEMVSYKYLLNLLANPWLILMLVAGLLLVIMGNLRTAKTTTNRSGIWFAGLGTVLVGLVVLLLPAFNNTAFYPSKFDLQSSLTIYNASSSLITLQVMTYVALGIPFVLAYIIYAWWQMNKKKIGVDDIVY